MCDLDDFIDVVDLLKVLQRESVVHCRSGVSVFDGEVKKSASTAEAG